MGGLWLCDNMVDASYFSPPVIGSACLISVCIAGVLLKLCLLTSNSQISFKKVVFLQELFIVSF